MANAAVHELNLQQTDLKDVRKEFLRFLHLTDYISHLLQQWAACGSSEGTRVFTDQWPDCTCVVILFCYEQVNPDEVQLCLVGGDSKQALQVLYHPGVVDWSKPLLFTNVIKLKGVKELLTTLNKSPDNHLRLYETMSVYYLAVPISVTHRSLPNGFYLQSLDESHADCIAEYWDYWTTKELRVAHLKLSIMFRDSVGIFTDSTTPHKLVSWAVRCAETGEVHHLYTLEGYRGRGLASAVVREMSRRIQDKGEVPFCTITLDNHASLTVFQKLGFVEDMELYCLLQHDPE